MLVEIKSAQAELREPKYYWQFANTYREKKEKLKEHIQREFKVWRKYLKALEMKVLDELHQSHFQTFEEKFQAAKTQNQRMFTKITDLVDDVERLIWQFRDKQTKDQHYIDFKLANSETIDLILTKAEA